MLLYKIIEFFKEHGVARWVTLRKANQQLITHPNSMKKFVDKIGVEDKNLSRNGFHINNLRYFYLDEKRKQNYC